MNQGSHFSLSGDVIKALGRIGFHAVRPRGSHLIMKHPDGRSTVIPVHPGEELGRAILREIIREVRMGVIN